MHNFDKIISRKDTHSVKHDHSYISKHANQTFPLWVADMDFRAPSSVLKALHHQVEHGIFGYTKMSRTYATAIERWFSTRHDWNISSSWLLQTPGVVFALSMVIQSLTRKGDSIMVQTPVYPPLFEMVTKNNRHLVRQALVYDDNNYHIDFDDFEKKIMEHKVKLFILCSPHNPVGRVWTKDELEKMAEICLRNKTIVCSDEVHADFVYPESRHTVFASMSPEISDMTITCTAPSKTFNLAGLQISNIIITNPQHRKTLKNHIQACGYSPTNRLGMIACESAYLHGEKWLDELIRYLHGNVKWLQDQFEEHIPQIKFIPPQGTYLAWLDCQKLGIEADQLDSFFINQAGMHLSSGSSFGDGGKGFQRLNFACSRIILKQAFRQLETAIRSL